MVEKLYKPVGEELISKTEIPEIEINGNPLVLVKSTKRGRRPRWLEIGSFKFTPRKLEVLYLKSKRKLTYAQAALELKISSGTAKSVIDNFKKLNRSENGNLPAIKELTAIAEKLGLLNEDSLTELKSIFK